MKSDGHPNTKTCFKKEAVVSPTDAAELHTALPVGPGFDGMEVVPDQGREQRKAEGESGHGADSSALRLPSHEGSTAGRLP